MVTLFKQVAGCEGHTHLFHRCGWVEVVGKGLVGRKDGVPSPSWLPKLPGKCRCGFVPGVMEFLPNFLKIELPYDTPESLLGIHPPKT